MISWITMAILSPVRRSTSGRAPWFRAIIRFWIRVESLKRPPTLLTISSSFSSSSIVGTPSTTVLDQVTDQLLDRSVDVFVQDMHVVRVPGLLDLATGVVQSPSD